MILLDRVVESEGNTEEVENLYHRLEKQMDLATTGEYEMNPPQWFGHPLLHNRHLAFLLTAWPELYADRLDKYGGTVEVGDFARIVQFFTSNVTL
jgi:hypothetical protein